MHRKYRPDSLDEVIGNDHIKSIIPDILNDVSPIMFEGEKGCGKTTLALIVAKMFGAVKENIIDLNCVYFSKIDDMRSQIDNIFKSSIFGNKKVLILDEIHELSSKSQQVLLKPLEALSHDTLVIACTTTTSSIKGTLLDRFIRLSVHSLNDTQSKQLLSYVMSKENLRIPKPILGLLISKSYGNPRKLLTGLSKLRNVGNPKEAEYLLDLNDLEVNSEAIDIVKMLLSKVSWKIMKEEIKNSLKDISPSSLRISILNILSYRLLSNYDINENIPDMYEEIKEAFSIPEKANLIMALYNSHKIMNGD